MGQKRLCYLPGRAETEQPEHKREAALTSFVHMLERGSWTVSFTPATARLATSQLLEEENKAKCHRGKRIFILGSVFMSLMKPWLSFREVCQHMARPLAPQPVLAGAGLEYLCSSSPAFKDMLAFSSMYHTLERCQQPNKSTSFAEMQMI